MLPQLFFFCISQNHTLVSECLTVCPHATSSVPEQKSPFNGEKKGRNGGGGSTLEFTMCSMHIKGMIEILSAVTRSAEMTANNNSRSGCKRLTMIAKEVIAWHLCRL